MTDPLATPEQLAIYLTEDVDTNHALMVLEFASAAIRAYCGWEITSFTASGALLDSDGLHTVSLPALRVTDVSKLEVQWCDDWDEIADFRWSQMGLIARRHCKNFPSGFRTVRVDYAGGYDSVPAGLAAVCCALAERVLGEMREQVGGISVQFGTLRDPTTATFAPVEKFILDRYKLPGRP